MDHSGLNWQIVAEVVEFQTSELGEGNAVFVRVGGKSLVRAVQRLRNYAATGGDRPPRLNSPLIPKIERALGLSPLSIRFLAQGHIDAFLKLDNPPAVRYMVEMLTTSNSTPFAPEFYLGESKRERNPGQAASLPRVQGN